MLVFHRYHLAAVTVLPALFVAHAAWEGCEAPTPSSFERPPCVERLTPVPTISQKVTSERAGLFWRWTYGQRRTNRVLHGLPDNSSLRMTWDPTPAQLQEHEVYREHARAHYVFPQLPLLERRGPWGKALWAFLPREVLKDFGTTTVDGDVTFVGSTAYVYYHPRHASGGHLYAIDMEHGEPIWRAEIAREAFQGWYRQDARVHHLDGKILLVLNTTTRAVTHELDPATGDLLDTRRLSPALSRLSGVRGSSPGPKAHTRVRIDTQGTTVYDAPSVYIRVSAPDAQAHNKVARLDPKVTTFLRAPQDARPEVEYREEGSLRWRLHLSGEHISNVVMHRGRMFVASFEPGRSGATLTAIDVANGKITWGARVHGLGARASTTSNAVRLHLVEGQVVVQGEESSGSYLEVVDVSTGQTMLSKNYPNLR